MDPVEKVQVVCTLEHTGLGEGLRAGPHGSLYIFHNITDFICFSASSVINLFLTDSLIILFNYLIYIYHFFLSDNYRNL